MLNLFVQSVKQLHDTGTSMGIHSYLTLTNNIQLFRERLLGKVHATILNGIVGGFEFSFCQRNLKELA